MKIITSSALWVDMLIDEFIIESMSF